MKKEFILLFGKLFIALLSLLMISLIASRFGEDGVAKFSIFIVIVNIFTVIFMMGNNVIILDKIGAGESADSVFFSLFVAIFIAIFLSSIFYINDQITISLALGVAASLAILSTLSSILYYRGKKWFGLLILDGLKTIFPFIGFIVTPFFVTSLVFEDEMVYAYSGLYFLSILMLLCIALYMYSKGVWVTWSRYFKNIRDGLILTIPVLMVVVSQQFDRIILSDVVDNHELASLFVAQSLFSILLMAMTVAVNSNIKEIAMIASCKNGSLDHLTRRMVVVLVCLFLISFPFSFLYLKWTLDDYSVAILIYIFLCSGYIFSVFFGLGQTVLQYFEDKSHYMRCMVLSILIQYSLLYVLLPLIGVYASPLSFIISMIFGRLIAAKYLIRFGVKVSLFDLK